MDGGGGDLRGVGGGEFAVDDGVEDGGAEGTADGAGGEGEARGGREEGVRRGELDEGDEQCQGARLPNARENIEPDLGVGHGWGDGAIADCSVAKKRF